MNEYHVSVLLQEAISALQITKGGKYIDATLGAGGHSKEILEKGGVVLGIDQDDEALQEVEKNLAQYIQKGQLKIVKGNFSRLSEIAQQQGLEKVQGILFDIGVSSHQLDTNDRGFSFMSNGPLDMRMDNTLGVRAADLVNGLTKGELIELFTKYGEEPFAKKIAEALTKARLTNPIRTTTELADIIIRNVPKTGKIHPATKVFQALRIAVNDELHSLEQGLRQAVDLLDAKGRLVIITFHSLEDRIAKRLFEEFQEKQMGHIMTNKPIVPTDKEIIENRRARSAKMRIFEKI